MNGNTIIRRSPLIISFNLHNRVIKKITAQIIVILQLVVFGRKLANAARRKQELIDPQNFSYCENQYDIICVSIWYSL